MEALQYSPRVQFSSRFYVVESLYETRGTAGSVIRQIASRLEQSLVALIFKLFEIFCLEQGDNGNGM
jgi:hypothetical protein